VGAREESDPKYITDSAEVRLRSFTTTVHKVDTMVAYKQES
jgi:mitotic spindle assembly checkpoint protein MAD2